MRIVAKAVAVLAAVLGVASPAVALTMRGERPKLVVKDVRHPDQALTWAIAYLQRVPPDDRPFTRFAWWASTPDGRLTQDLTNWRAYLQTVSSETNIAFPVEVRESGGRLWAFDLRDMRWTVAAFSAVARRDVVFTEPHCDSRLAETIRREIGVRQDPATFHVEAIVPGPWLLRRIMDPDGTESTTYYDLLYAVERFGAEGVTARPNAVPVVVPVPPEPQKPQPRPWKGGVWSADGKDYPAGSFDWTPQAELDAWTAAHAKWAEAKKAAEAKPVKELLLPGGVVNAKPVKDFPADLNDFRKRWGTAANEAFLKEQKLFVNNGEIVAGSKSDPKRGSYVSYQDRVIHFGDGQFNNGGLAMSTQDFLRTSGAKNPSNLPREASLFELQEDAGEHLTTMPNGFQAALLTGAAKEGRKRVEFGDARLVHSSLDPRDVTVRTQFSCTICHARQDGVLSPSNRKVGETLARGVELFIRGKQNQLAVKGFFDEVEWKLEIGRVAYRRGLAKATATQANPGGWSGRQWSEATVDFRNWYDEPVDLDQAAAELGYPRFVVMLACLSEGSIDAGNLFMGEAVPRTVWDDDLFRSLSLLIAATANLEDPDPLLLMFGGDLIREAKLKARGK